MKTFTRITGRTAAVGATLAALVVSGAGLAQADTGSGDTGSLRPAAAVHACAPVGLSDVAVFAQVAAPGTVLPCRQIASALGIGSSDLTATGSSGGSGPGGSSTTASAVGSNNVGENNTGSYNVGPENTGSHNIGSSNTGSGNVGSANTGSGNVGSANTGSGNVGSANTGSTNVGSANTGSSNTGFGNFGSLVEGSVLTGFGSVAVGSLGINWN
ncbi:hypothetical protein [Rhodococcus gannanensis]|jgi:PPE-repeat protein|uniref:Pentapeptide repeat-containing protein n=1 Tax=Rhodococcus gannanensis TaxID=1960308 RepID=A0ABW4P0P8_9NOCA